MFTFRKYTSWGLVQGIYLVWSVLILLLFITHAATVHNVYQVIVSAAVRTKDQLVDNNLSLWRHTRRFIRCNPPRYNRNVTHRPIKYMIISTEQLHRIFLVKCTRFPHSRTQGKTEPFNWSCSFFPLHMHRAMATTCYLHSNVQYPDTNIASFWSQKH